MLRLTLNPLNPAGRFSGLRKHGAKNPAGRFSGICFGVSKTQRASKPAHVRPKINWFVYTGRYQATLKSQVESSSLFNFRTICNLLTGFCTWCTILHRKYGGDTQCMRRYWYSLDFMDNVEELYNQKIGFWDRNRVIYGTCWWAIYMVSRWNVVITGIYAAKKRILVRYRGSLRVSGTPYV